MKKVTLVLYVADQEAEQLRGVQHIPTLPNLFVHYVGSVDIEPCDQPFGFESWMDGASDGRARFWFDTSEQMEKGARSAVRDGKCVRYLVREVAADGER
jgi:hypothetical protein